MMKNLILTLSGPDRVGIVERVTGLLLARGGNVETSRMARLGGEFAILMLVSIPGDRIDGIEGEFDGLAAEGYKISTRLAEPPRASPHAGWTPFRIEVEGADHEGIIHEVARYLSEKSINIESIDSETTLAPVSGSPLFSMTAQVVAPPSLPATGWAQGLQAIADRLNLEIRVEAESEA